MNEEILQKLNEVLLIQQELRTSQAELKAMMQLVGNPPDMRGDVWLTKEQVMKKLFIEKRTFYRKRKKYNWVVRNEAGKLVYLESSLVIEEF